MTGVIGVSECPVSKPRRVSSALNRLVFVPEPLAELRLVAHDPDRLAACGDDGRRMRRREEERPRSLGQDLAQCLGPGDVAAESADGLRQRTDLDGDAAVEAEMVDGAAAVPTEDARGMGVVDHDGRTELLGRLDHAGEWRDVAIHREDAVGDDQDQPIVAAARPPVLASLAEHLAERGHVGVGIDLARRLRQPHPVDDRGVVERVRHDQVRLAGDGRDDTGVGGEAGLEGEDGRRALELGELGLERLVHRHRPGDGPDRPAADAELADGLERGLAQARVVGQAEVVVRREAR